MLAYEFAEKRWGAFGTDDRLHLIADKTSTLCGIGWLTAERNAATRVDWVQCSLCAHYEADRQEVWQLDPDGPCYNHGTPEEVDDGGTASGAES